MPNTRPESDDRDALARRVDPWRWTGLAWFKRLPRVVRFALVTAQALVILLIVFFWTGFGEEISRQTFRSVLGKTGILAPFDPPVAAVIQSSAAAPLPTAPRPRPAEAARPTRSSVPKADADSATRAALAGELQRLAGGPAWTPQPEWAAELDQKPIVVRATSNGVGVAATLITRLERMGVRVRFEPVAQISQASAATISYGFADLRAAQMIEASMADRLRLSLTSNSGADDMVVWLR